MVTRPADEPLLVLRAQAGDRSALGEDEMVKVNGQWFFTKRKIYNEGSARWQYKGDRNPAW